MMSDTDFGYSEHTVKEMLDHIGVSEADQAQLYRIYPPPYIQQHAAYTVFAMMFQDVQNPPAWLKASLRGNWKAPKGFDAQQQVMHFRIDANTWAEFEKIVPCGVCGGSHPEKDCPAKIGE